jgi:hypothetical protein
LCCHSKKGSFSMCDRLLSVPTVLASHDIRLTGLGGRICGARDFIMFHTREVFDIKASCQFGALQRFAIFVIRTRVSSPSPSFINKYECWLSRDRRRRNLRRLHLLHVSSIHHDNLHTCQPTIEFQPRAHLPEDLDFVKGHHPI